MADVTANGQAPRVVLLARAGKAAEQLAEALRQSGAELLIAVDPGATDEAALRALRPQAVLVALEPSIEASLDNLDGLLSDPDITVIFDEADVAAHRSGWDAARWVRHLSAKLRNDSNVLPPGAENDQDMQPSPGQIPRPDAAYANVDLADFTREAVALADSVPVDGVPSEPPPAMPASDALPFDAGLVDAIPSSPPVGPAPSPAPPKPAPSASAALALEPIALDTVVAERESTPFAAAPQLGPSVAASAPVGLSQIEDTQLGGMDLDGMQLESMQLDSVQLDGMQLESVELDSVSFEGESIEEVRLEGVSLDEVAPAAGEDFSIDGLSLETPRADASSGVAPMQFDDDAFFLESLSADGAPRADVAPALDMSGFDLQLDDDVGNFSAPATPRQPEAVLSFEELIAAAAAPPAVEPSPAPSPAPVAAAKPALSLGELSLAPVDDAPTPVAKPRAEAAPDLSMLEARISSLSLVEIDDGAAAKSAAAPFAAPGSADSVVLIEAGLGGPDPTRQLLSALPAGFPAIVLVRLHLQGGRYDRLVAQMERAAALPVTLAEAGGTALPGTIYFLPEGVGVATRGLGLGFVTDPAPTAGTFAALSPAASAVVFLSGSDPQLIELAMAAAATGTMVMAQSPEDCYDGAACAELRNRGVTAGLPTELAGRLASRWPV